MRAIFLAATLLISAPVHADKIREFSAFLDEYKVFAEKRALQSKTHSAQFSSILTFRTEQCGQDEGALCICPPGDNQYLQCLTSAKAVIKTDPNDLGGRGYILVSSAGFALSNVGQWVPMNTRGVYTAAVESLGPIQTVNIPIPNSATIASLCSESTGAVEFAVGYGAVMPMDMEFAARMKERSASLGLAYDEHGFVFTRARTNGMRSKKGGVAGTIGCHPSSQQQSGAG